MEDKHEEEKLIGKLIKKRKQENDAFIKLLNAIENKGNEVNGITKYKAKSKT